MVTAIKWFVRILLGVIFVDWFVMRYNAEKEIEVEPAGMVMIDIGTQQVYRVAFGCAADDLHEGDVVPMEIRLINEQETEEKET